MLSSSRLALPPLRGRISWIVRLYLRHPMHRRPNRFKACACSSFSRICFSVVFNLVGDDAFTVLVIVHLTDPFQVGLVSDVIVVSVFFRIGRHPLILHSIKLFVEPFSLINSREESGRDRWIQLLKAMLFFTPFSSTGVTASLVDRLFNFFTFATVTFDPLFIRFTLSGDHHILRLAYRGLGLFCI